MTKHYQDRTLIHQAHAIMSNAKNMMIMGTTPEHLLTKMYHNLQSHIDLMDFITKQAKRSYAANQLMIERINQMKDVQWEIIEHLHPLTQKQANDTQEFEEYLEQERKSIDDIIYEKVTKEFDPFEQSFSFDFGK